MKIYILGYIFENGERLEVACKQWKQGEKSFVSPSENMRDNEWVKFKEHYHRPVNAALCTIISDKCYASFIVDVVEVPD